MLKKLIAIAMAFCASLAMAAVDVNKANSTELSSIKGIGEATASRIIDARKQGAFKNWDDFIARVKGVAGPSANKLSEAGLTVNGQPFKAAVASAAPKAQTSEKIPKPAQSSGKKQEKP